MFDRAVDADADAAPCTSPRPDRVRSVGSARPAAGIASSARDERSVNQWSSPSFPEASVEARRTPLFDVASLPAALSKSHRTTVWAELRVQSGAVRFVDLDEDDPRDLRLETGDRAVIVPGVEHHVEPSTDATFYVQFYREPEPPRSRSGGAPVDVSPPVRAVGAPRTRSGHRGRDLRDGDAPVRRRRPGRPPAAYFNFGPGFIDWRAHIGSVTDYWCHVVLYAPDYEIDVIEHHRHLHHQDPFTPELLDRWLQIFYDTVDGGWTGPHATTAKKRATGMAWVMASRFLGKGAWRPAERR